jgi:bacterioferritin
VDKQSLLNGLDEALAYEYAAVIQYISYSARTTGPYRPELSEYFLAEVADEQGHAQ